jgi:cytochrome c-type biogenesis protein CcmF
MSEIGYSSLLFAFFFSIYSIISLIIGIKKEKQEFIKSGKNSSIVVSILLTISSISLIYLLIIKDFSIRYVAEYTSKSLPILYAISAFWAGQDGSILFWVWILSLFSMILIVQNRKRNRAIIPYVLSIIMAIELFFIILLLFVSSPFEILTFMPADGLGLNPLLQNPGMLFHPPTLYLGYVGFSIPFSFAMAALIKGDLGEDWIRSTRRWTLFSWFFLGAGNLLGAEWAYTVLGWGGYWGWDPVENASLMPWITGTAYLHSVMIQEKRGMLKIWNIVLIILTFILTILGTFITRSGIISSVHSFGESNLGPFFLIFLIIVVTFSLVLLFNRIHILKSVNMLESFISRESSFLFNNLILVGIAFTTLWGTIFPIISELIRGVKVSVGAPFYNQVNTPLGLLLLILTGICPLISWRKATPNNLKKNFLFPLIVSIIAGVIFILIGINKIYSLLIFTSSIFVLTTIIVEFHRGTKGRGEIINKNYITSLFSLILRNKRRYGGYIVHTGVVLIFIGIGGNGFKIEKDVTLNIGSSFNIRDYNIKYDNLYGSSTEHKDVVIAVLSIYKYGKRLCFLNPEKDFYRNYEQPVTEVAILSSLKEDLYIILGSYDKNKRASFKAIINPLVSWIWIGGIVIMIGTIIVMLPDKRKKQL